MTDTTTATPNEIDAIANEAAKDEVLNTPAPGTPEAQAQEAAAAIDYAAEAFGLIEFANESFLPLYPKLADIYTMPKRKAIADALGKVFERYGLTLGGLFSNPWVNLAVVTIPVIVPTYKVIKEAHAENAQEVKTVETVQPIGAPSDNADTLYGKA